MIIYTAQEGKAHGSPCVYLGSSFIAECRNWTTAESVARALNTEPKLLAALEVLKELVASPNAKDNALWQRARAAVWAAEQP